MRALSERIDCLVVDWRVTDLTGVGYICADRAGQLIPELIMHDDRPGWEPEYMRVHLGTFAMLVNMNGADVGQVVDAFMNRIGVLR